MKELRRLAFGVFVVGLSAGIPPSVADVCDGISPASHVPLTSVRVASGLTRPLFVASPPDDVERLFVVEQDGRIRLVRDGVLLPAPFLDVSALTRSPSDGGGSEEGLLGLAFDPGYASNGRFFVYRTDVTGANNLVERFERSAANPDLADPATRAPVLTIPHPSFTNHNGGMIAFGPNDGHLYVGTGDGGWSCDPSGNAQNQGSLLGKLLRIDVRSLPYSVPLDNPFVKIPSYRPEIWALGLRNPWRWSFDRVGGDLYIGDVGEGILEEINFSGGASAGGENYGWDRYEGSVCPNPSCGDQGPCALTGYVPPVYEYDQAGPPCAVTGGYVYRGCRMPGLAGSYFLADYCAAFIRSFRMSSGAVTDLQDRTAELAPGGGLAIGAVNSFGEDGRGEVYIVDRGGEVFKIVPVLGNLEVSGVGAVPFRLDSGSWSWEDLAASSSHPVTDYRVYRQTGRGQEFECVHQGPGTGWAGDPDDPPDGAAYFYLVTAVTGAGAESSPGSGTGGAPRPLSTLPCPP